MIVLASIATFGALVLTVLLWFANAMSAPSGHFLGITLIVVAWLVVAALWSAWWFR